MSLTKLIVGLASQISVADPPAAIKLGRSKAGIGGQLTVIVGGQINDGGDVSSMRIDEVSVVILPQESTALKVTICTPPQVWINGA